MSVMRAALLCALLAATPAAAEMCPSTSAAIGTAALIGPVCTPIPTQKSDVYSATPGFTYTVPSGVTIAIINAPALLALGTITLPATAQDGVPLTLEAPHGITAVTINAPTGQYIAGNAVSAMTAMVPYRFKYSAVNSTWYPN